MSLLFSPKNSLCFNLGFGVGLQFAPDSDSQFLSVCRALGWGEILRVGTHPLG